jgi:hypothetical protein
LPGFFPNHPVVKNGVVFFCVGRERDFTRRNGGNGGEWERLLAVGCWLLAVGRTPNAVCLLRTANSEQRTANSPSRTTFVLYSAFGIRHSATGHNVATKKKFPYLRRIPLQRPVRRAPVIGQNRSAATPDDFFAQQKKGATKERGAWGRAPKLTAQN